MLSKRRRADRDLRAVRLRQLQLDRDPDRRDRRAGARASPDLARFGLRAVLGGSIATFMTATIARRAEPFRLRPWAGRRRRFVQRRPRGRVASCRRRARPSAATTPAGPGARASTRRWRRGHAQRPRRFRVRAGRRCRRLLARTLCAADGSPWRRSRANCRPAPPGSTSDAAGRNCIVVGAGANAALDAGFATAHSRRRRTRRWCWRNWSRRWKAIAMAMQAGRDAGATVILNPAPANAAVPAPPSTGAHPRP